MDLIQQVCQTPQYQANPIALKTPNRAYTWQQLDEQVDAIALIMQTQGVVAGSVIALVSKNNVEALLLYLASLRLGALCALMPPQPKMAMQQKLDIIQADFIWSGDIDNHELAELPQTRLHLEHVGRNTRLMASSHTFHAEQLASIVFTSGSTGVPKAVVHAAKHHLASAKGLTEKFEFTNRDTWLLSLPMYHVSGLSIIWRWLAKRACLAIGSGQLEQDISVVTHASLVPIQLQRLFDSGIPLPLKRVLLGGSHIPMPLIEQAQQKGIECWLGYGMTESASTVIAKPVDGSPSAGWLLPYRKIKLENGRIYVAGDTLAAGYLAHGQLTPLVSEEQPWFDTKDLAQRYVQDGKPDEFIIVGRADNQFISGGENIHCEEIESALLKYPDIKQALVIPVEDTQYGYRPVAFIDAESPLDTQAYQAFLQQYLQKFKCPERYYLLPQELMNTGIKISRAALKAYYQQHLS
ncbi:o-succinylbenzoate--CoA ligase [Vibrio gangliei]|uniref:o-succinylbenzoate--CoA ligase n=1 Tax=Vibrio gangliei TaxID=2077090 RepID=UPI000D013A29|nr:o-succinylbenzoate--CoA ligase [Vibrio gangliei]